MNDHIATLYAIRGGQEMGGRVLFSLQRSTQLESESSGKKFMQKKDSALLIYSVDQKTAIDGEN